MHVIFKYSSLLADRDIKRIVSMYGILFLFLYYGNACVMKMMTVIRISISGHVTDCVTVNLLGVNYYTWSDKLI